MRDFQKKYIITGAPGTGKTTLINLLKQEVPCQDEVSRRVIIDQQNNGGDAMPWLDINKFVNLVYNITKEEFPNNEALICDRSLLDLEAYLAVAEKEIPNYLQTCPYHDMYHKKVFFAPTWQDIYCKDAQRPQEFEYCVALEKVLLEYYKKRGFDIVMLSRTSPLKRAEFILDVI